MRVALVGNHTPLHSTETHLARAWENNGHEVDRWQENDLRTWENLGEIPQTNVDLIMWVRTGWDWNALGVTEQWAHTRMRRMLRFAADKGTPVVAYHLDRWFGLKRETQLDTEPFFECPLVITADGGHQAEFAQRAIAHTWFPPGVSLNETEPGMWRSDLASPLAFVGSHNGDYHAESTHRHELVRWLKTNFARDCAFWPRPGEHALRGPDLRDLYASVDVLVGDSCFAGGDNIRYASDRLPESTGRAGLLCHPRVEGVTDWSTWGIGDWPTWNEGVHLLCWDAFDWDGLGATIDWALSHPTECTMIRASAREHVREHHTYERRMDQLIELLYERKLLKRPRKASTK